MIALSRKLAIIIEEHREVVDITINLVMRPRTLGTVRDIHLQAMPVDIGEDIELSVMISDGRRPDTPVRKPPCHCGD